MDTNQDITYIPSKPFADPAVYETDIGTIIAATEKGVGYKDTNEDRVVVLPDEHFFAVIDGMGGVPGGEQAAQILAEEFTNTIGDEIEPEKVQERAAERMQSEGITEGGAVYQAAYVDDTYTLSAFQAGDAQLIVYTPDEDIHLATNPERMMMGGLTNGVRGVDAGRVTTHDSLELTDGMRIAVASDGVWDNVSPEDFVQLASSLSLEATVPQIGSLLTTQMKNKSGKPDNISLVVCEIEKED